ncbi:hypothetical protein C0Q70_18653 [Pomacea canaliculata]|uniref:Methyltransferase domain-containing protein n=1 Tax=Pomacea canaliculata TaxID=400727 RepID=A0A2T7NH39_POMCA|nr:hypothetical protein C0Q70_18653 [Pomacea canaliculata]
MLDTADHKRGDLVFFKRIGISDKDNEHFVPRVDEYVQHRPAVNGWPMRRLQTILDLLGHRKEQLTVLKMDIEGYEWNVTRDLLDSAILSSVPQFLVEWHLFTDFPPRERVPDAVDTYFRLNDMGFQLFVTGGFYKGSATSLRMQAEKPTSQPTNQPTNQPASQPASQPTNQPTNPTQPTNQPINMYRQQRKDNIYLSSLITKVQSSQLFMVSLINNPRNR